MSDTEDQRLNRLLTWLITAVSQQFFHLLLLRKRGRHDLAARLKAVDDTDFPTAIRIIALLLQRGATISVEPHVVAPARSTGAILRRELAFERRLERLLSSLEMQSPDGRAHLLQAEAPRSAYRAWLAVTLRQTPAEPVDPCNNQSSPELFATLLLLMEQTLLHAFAYRHEGQVAQASTAWQISGAAMLYLTELADFCGSDDRVSGGIPVPALTVLDADARFDADMHLVRASAAAARRLADDGGDPRLALLCLTIAEDCDLIALTENGGRIEAQLGRSNVFRDFGRATKYLARVSKGQEVAIESTNGPSDAGDARTGIPGGTSS